MIENLYSIVILYRDRILEDEKRYTLYTKNSEVIFRTDSKYEMRIYLDLIGYTLGKVLDDRYRVMNFNKKWGGYTPKIVGRAYKLKKNKVKTKNKV